MADDHHPSSKNAKRACVANNNSTNPPPKEGGRASPSGFVLKLYQMVNGAADDILSWTPNGEAFRISDLSRLESETLPSFFRHSRFQSLVRQLNFYNFRKINRERTFWVYHHPLFHRDRPQDLHKLRRRTCPGFDGRRHRPYSPTNPSAAASQGTMEDSIMSNEDAMDMDEDEDEDSPDFMSPAGGAKVSRSPSPSSYHQGSSNSPLDHPVGRGSVRASNRLGGLKSVISEEEKSPIVLKKNRLSSSSKKSSSAWDNTSLESMDSKNDYKRVSSRSDSDGNSLYNGSTLSKDRSRLSSLPTHPPPASTTSKNGKRDSSTWPTTDDHNDDYSTSSSSNIRRRYSSEEVHELAEISRQLNVICNEYAASNSTRKPRRGRPPASGAAGGGSGGTGGHYSFGGRSVLAFGFEKPDTHYSFTKCDLFTYDDEDGVLYDQDDASESQTEKEKTVVSSSPEKLQIKVDIAPPSEDRGIIESLIRACQMSNPASSAEKSIVAAILSFCLSTHPQDPDIAVKIVSHLIICPMLAEEFELYCKALSRGMTLGYSSFLPMWTHLTDKSRLVPPNSTEALSMPAATTSTDICVRNKGGMSALEDLKRDWKTFSLNYIHRTISSFQSAGDATASTNYGIQLNLAQHEAVNRCATIWFQ